MIMFDKKKAMATIMSRRQHADGSMSEAPMKPEKASMEDGKMDGRHAAMEDFMRAHAEGSASKMVEAMVNFMDLHNSHKAEDTEPEVPKQPDKES